MNAEQTFRAKAPGIIARLLGDFPLVPMDGFAILGNSGHECLGFTKLQEIAPTVKGSKGGFGWYQWTGPRRRAFEAYCARNGLDPGSDQANYAWLFIELKGSEKAAIGKVREAGTLRLKVEAFERSFLRAGVKAYNSRTQWAMIAQSAWSLSGLGVTPTPIAEQKAVLTDEATASGLRAETAGRQAKGVGGTGGVVVGGGAAKTATSGINFTSLADWLLVGVGVALFAGTALLVWHSIQNRRKAKVLVSAAETVGEAR